MSTSLAVFLKELKPDLVFSCEKPEVVNRHGAKVYGKAASGSPSMSVPHLDPPSRALRAFYPQVNEQDWHLSVAGQRVQIIHEKTHYSGQLEFGTEIVASADSSLVALLGASPGASTATYIIVQMIERILHPDLVGDWQAKMSEIIPSYGHDLKQEAGLLQKLRADTAEVLGLQNV